MKKLIAILSIVALNGCAAYDAYLLGSYDPNEYQLTTQIRLDARHYKETCDDPVASKANALYLANKTELFVAYSEYRPHNSNAIKASQALNEIAQGLKDKYNTSGEVSTLFCKMKFEGVEHGADTIQHVLGNRPK
jgi:hypothetical protein